MTDGLTAMEAARARNQSRSRKVPPPRHKAKPRDEEPAPTSDQAPPEQDPTPATPAAAPTAAGETPGDLSPRTIYLDRPSDDWLEDIAIAGRRAQPRVAASRSAVVRYALERLRADLEPHQVIDVLASRGDATTKPGRKRR